MHNEAVRLGVEGVSFTTAETKAFFNLHQAELPRDSDVRRSFGDPEATP